MTFSEIMQAVVAVLVAYLAYRKGADRMTLVHIQKTANDTHTLVNSNMGIQLRLNAELSRWKAEQTKHHRDLEAAELAERLYAEHQTKQGIVDGRDNREGE